MLDYVIPLVTEYEPSQAFIPLLLTAAQAGVSIAKGVGAAKAAKDAARVMGNRADEDSAEAARRKAAIERGDLMFEPEKLKLADETSTALDTSMSRSAEDVGEASREMALASAISSGSPVKDSMFDLFGDKAREGAIAGIQGRADALTSFGTESMRVDDANTTAFNTQALKEFNQADQMERAAKLGRFAADDAYTEAERARKGALYGGIADATIGLVGMGAELYGSDKTKESMQDYNDYQDKINTGIKDDDDTAPNAAAKGRKFEFKNGGDMMVTEGEFSHETNKKAIIDEETGEKEGELTGQEAIVFNDEHVSIIEELTNSGDEETLMEFMKHLLSQPQFQDQA